MRVLIQRVTQGRCRIDGEVFSSIAQGLVVLVGVGCDEERIRLYIFHSATFSSPRMVYKQFSVYSKFFI